jgi:hypothetical protein
MTSPVLSKEQHNPENLYQHVDTELTTIHSQARIRELEDELAKEKRLTQQQQTQMSIFEDQVLRRYKDMHREQEKSRQHMLALEQKVFFLKQSQL